MSIIPISCLTHGDLARLGNNLSRRPVESLNRRRNRATTAAVNRSLMRLDEQIDRLHCRSIFSIEPTIATEAARTPRDVARHIRAQPHCAEFSNQHWKSNEANRCSGLRIDRFRDVRQLRGPDDCAAQCRQPDH
jgi:hypothetical protein